MMITYEVIGEQLNIGLGIELIIIVPLIILWLMEGERFGSLVWGVITIVLMGVSIVSGIRLIVKEWRRMI